MRQPLLFQGVKTAPLDRSQMKLRPGARPLPGAAVYSRLTSAPNSSSQCFRKPLCSVSFYRHTHESEQMFIQHTLTEHLLCARHHFTSVNQDTISLLWSSQSFRRKQVRDNKPREFPGGPVVRTLHRHCQGLPGLNPWTGNWDPASCKALPDKKIRYCLRK